MNDTIAFLAIFRGFNGGSSEGTSQFSFNAKLTAGTLMSRLAVALALTVVGMVAFGGCVGLISASNTSSRAAVTTLPGRLSVQNIIPDFYAEASANGNSLKFTPQGGYFESSAGKTFYMPWGYVTTQWNIGTIYIIFLANVTATNFSIGFLYLTNSSTPFIFRTFQYRNAYSNSITFYTGIQYVFARTVTSPSVPIPPITIQPEAQSQNSLAALGSELYVSGDHGLVINGTETLHVYPLLNQLYDGPTDYNELWVLLTDSTGYYYFAILYMQNSDHGQVIMEHQLRLNDYQKLPGRSLEAAWSTGPFTNRLTVKLPQAGEDVTVNGFPLKTDDKGLASILVPSGKLKVQAPDQIQSSQGTRMKFIQWKGQPGGNPITLQVESALTLIAEYQTEYLLAIQSEFGEVQGAGWYTKDANASFSVTSMITSDNGTRRVFNGWTGDFSSSNSLGWVTMDSAKSVTANWKTQYELVFNVNGAPENSTVELLVNDQHLTITGTEGTAVWFDASTAATITVQTTSIQEPAATYTFTGLQIDGQPSDGRLTITKPAHAYLTYSSQPKLPSSISLQVSPVTSVQGFPVSITGSISPASQAVVSLYYSVDATSWDSLANITTAADGSFSYSWVPSHPSTYYVRAYWQGDEQHTPAVKVATVKVEATSLPVDNNSGRTLFQDLGFNLGSIPFATIVLGLAQALLSLGMAVGVLLFPEASTFAGYFIGSLLVGFVYVFPASAVALSIKAARSRRSPSAVWLTPIATMWVAAVALVASGGSLLGMPTGLIEASTVLLILSNILMIPLAVSLFLAKVIAS